MQEVISTSSSYKMLSMMRGVVNGGTGSSIRRLGVTADAAGKTGTSNDNADGWFIGYTPSLVSGVWVGGDEYDIHFDSMAYGQGARMALPIWANYMKEVLADDELPYSADEKFEFPENYDPCMEESLKEEEVVIETANEGLDNLFD